MIGRHVLASELPWLSISPRIRVRDSLWITTGLRSRSKIQRAHQAPPPERGGALLIEGMHGLVSGKSIHYWHRVAGSNHFTLRTGHELLRARHLALRAIQQIAPLLDT